MFQQVADRLGIDFHHLELHLRILQQIAGQHAGSGADLQHRPAAAQRSHDGLCDALIGQEMLPEGFLGPDRLPHWAMKYWYIRAMP